MRALESGTPRTDEPPFELHPQPLPPGWSCVLSSRGLDPHDYTLLRSPDGLSVILVRDGFLISREDRLPTWDEVRGFKEWLFPPEIEAVMVLPPASEYVNHHPFMLHVYRSRCGRESRFDAAAAERDPDDAAMIPPLKASRSGEGLPPRGAPPLALVELPMPSAWATWLSERRGAPRDPVYLAAVDGLVVLGDPAAPQFTIARTDRFADGDEMAALIRWWLGRDGADVLTSSAVVAGTPYLVADVFG